MKKIISLVTVMLAVLSVNAQDWNASQAGVLAQGTTILDNDYVTVVTAVQDTESAAYEAPMTYAGFTFTGYVNIRVDGAPAADNNFEGTAYTEASPNGISLIVTAKKNVDMTLYYKHGDGKAVSCLDQTANESVVINETAVEGLASYYTGTYQFIGGHIYTIYARGGTTCLNGISTAEGTYVEPTGMVYAYTANANKVTYNDGANMQITGNENKLYGKGANIVVNGATYTSIKNTNGAQNTFTAPEGKKIYRMSFYAVPNNDGSNPKFTEFNGATVNYEITTVKDGANPTQVVMCANGAQAVTFTYSVKQVNFVVDVDYSEASYSAQYDPTNPGETPVEIDINATNFPDENFRNYLLAQDYGKDGVLTVEEIKGITSIDVTKNEISSLKGIEYFTALTNLYCYGNQLTALDVSENTALTELYCNNNQLTALDVSKNTALTWLSCANNQLTALDVSKNTELTWLTFEFNQLTAIDVSKNTALTYLLCAYNQLTALDVSKNTALTELYCYSNQLTALDVSKNTALSWLSSNYNQLSTLDVSKNTALKNMSCYGNNIKGEAMTALINSLPEKSSNENCYFIAIYNPADETNILTKSQAAAVKAKGWIPQYYNSGWKEYEGSDDEGGEVLPSSPIISFADSNVKTLCVQNWDTDGDGDLSEAEAAAVSTLGQVFKGNVSITSFDELAYFTGLTRIGDNAFYGCSGLASVVISNGVTSIGSCAFQGCSSLQTISIPKTVTTINKYAFADCSSMTLVEIGEGVTSIKNYVFQNCNSLQELRVLATTPPSADNYAFSNYNVTLSVPEASIASYQATSPWSNFTTPTTPGGDDPTIEKCEKPTIRYADGKLTFSCATEGVEYHWSIINDKDNSGTGNEVMFAPKVTVSVYASKNGYRNSDAATLDISVSGLKGDVNNNGGIDIGDAVTIVNFLVGKTTSLSRTIGVEQDEREPQ